MRITRLYMLLAVMISAVFSADAMADQRMVPPSWAAEKQLPEVDARFSVEGIDAAAVRKADLDSYKPGTALQFAQARKLQMDVMDGAEEHLLDDGQYVSRIRVESPGATDINLHFSRFDLPEGARVYLYDEQRQLFQGPWTHDDAKANGEFWSPLVPGDVAIVEVVWSQKSSKRPELRVEQVFAGYRDMGGQAGGPFLEKSHGSCNIDVVCPEGDDWRDEIRSVGVYSRGGSTLCTGTLVSDANRSFTPYFLTADHCGNTAANASSVVVYWNFESPVCGDRDGGSLTQNTTGATLRASRQDVDMSLLELDEQPDSDFNVHYAGWDRSGEIPTGTVAIHHPATHVKSISFAESALSYRDSCIGSGGVDSHWNVPFWDQGTTEPGSSGSAIFHPQRKRVIGFLSGGQAACGNQEYDCYGRMDVAWNGDSADSRLNDWLDPDGISSPEGIDGTDESGFAIEVDPVRIDQCGFADIDWPVTVNGLGGFTDPVTLSLEDAPAGLSATYSSNPVVPTGSSNLQLRDLDSAGTGVYQMRIVGTNGELQSQTSIELALADGVLPAGGVTAPADGSVDIRLTPQIEWQAVSGASSYQLQLATDDSFSTPVLDVMVDGTAHVPDPALQQTTEYFVRVRAINDCGDGAWSTVSTFTTGSQICLVVDQPIPDSSPAGITSTISVNDGAAIDKLEIAMDIAHTWVGDLIIDLVHQSSGTSVRLMDRPGTEGGGFGCGGADVDVVFDDDAPLSIQDDCQSGAAFPEPTYRPAQSLAALSGLSLAGDWTLSVSDNAGGDTGVLQEWCLLPVSEQPPEELIFSDRFEQ